VHYPKLGRFHARDYDQMELLMQLGLIPGTERGLENREAVS
jgi:hypothetical protein